MITSLNLINMIAKRIGNPIFGFAPIILLSKQERWRKQAKALNLSKTATQRLEWLIYYEIKADSNATLTCRHFGIVLKTFYKWKNAFDGKNLLLLEDRSRAPKRTRQRQITSTEEERIINLRKQHLRWGKMKIWPQKEENHRT